MSDKIEDIVIPILRTLQCDVSMTKESIQRIDARIASIENIQAGFHSTLNWHGQELDEHRGRLEALESDPSED